MNVLEWFGVFGIIAAWLALVIYQFNAAKRIGEAECRRCRERGDK